MPPNNWDWQVMPSQQTHSERVTMIRPIKYEMTSPLDPQLFEDQFMSRHGKALTINVSSGGMLVLMDHVPDLLQVIKIHVPMPNKAQIPTLAEVAWTRPFPLKPDNIHFVGLKFVL
jgi:hypothetical protein